MIKDETGNPRYAVVLREDITERKEMEAERLRQVQFLENIDRVERSFGDSAEIEVTMGQALETLLSIFGCDRTWLVYPCDPSATTCRVVVHRSVSGLPEALSEGEELPITPDLSGRFSAALQSSRPCVVCPEKGLLLPGSGDESIKSSMTCALIPKLGSPWAAGIGPMHSSENLDSG